MQLHGIMLRRTKAEVLDLPPKIRSWLDVEVASRVARDMSEAVTELLQTISRRGQAQAYPVRPRPSAARAKAGSWAS